MSILLAYASTTLPAAVPSTMQSLVTAVPAGAPRSSIGLETELLIWSVWAVVAVIVARLLGAFRRGSVGGPQRLSPEASAFDLLAVLCFAFFLEIVVTTAFARHLRPETEMSKLIAEAAGKSSSGMAIILACALLGVVGLNRLGLGIRRTVAGITAGAATIFILFPFIELTGSAVLGIEHLFHLHRADMHPVLQTLRDSHSQVTKITGTLLAVLVAPVAEELFFRGMLQTALCRLCDWVTFELGRSLGVGGTNSIPDESQPPGPSNRVTLDYYSGAYIPSELHPTGPRWAAIFVTSAIFAAAHGQAEFLAPLFVLSVGLGYAYERTGNLWVTMTSHALFNAAQILLLMASA